ncbi:MAG: YjgN family protein [Planctomycetes bacterium]|nr:YjgN family protein [Planctomycetota bacterium]
MSISITCESCGKSLKVPASYAGKKAKCKCGAIIKFPEAEEEEAVAVAAADDDDDQEEASGATSESSEDDDGEEESPRRRRPAKRESRGSVAREGSGLPMVFTKRADVLYGFSFSGSGGGLFAELIVGWLLTIVTFGIYLPWFMCKLNNWVCSNLVLKSREGKAIRVRFDGSGGELFGTFIVGALLTCVTFGIYYFWFSMKLTKFFTDNTHAETDDGEEYDLKFTGTGAEFFGRMILGTILCAVTLYIYFPWFICDLTKFYYEHLAIEKEGEAYASFEFDGTGGELFVTYLVGALLTMVTFGLYAPWFHCKMMEYFLGNTAVIFAEDESQLSIRFTGTGGEYFVTLVVGAILTAITFGIYYFWFTCKQLKFHYDNIAVVAAGD